MLQQENMAEKELVVGSLKVLGNLEGAGYKKVKESVENLRNSVKNIGSKQEDYWSSLSADGEISPIEKKQLKKEYAGIDQTHTALMAQAEAKGVTDSREVKNYDEAFDTLHDYLYVTLALFDNMSEPTKIESAAVFNSYYSTYYYWLQNAQAKVNLGEPGKIRYLTSLLEEGYDDEVAIYENQFYKYDLTNREWVCIQVASKLGEYMGVLTESPPQILNQYFLVGPSGIATDYIVWSLESRDIEQNAWTDENGQVIYINYGFETGYIYYWSEDNEFVKVSDKNNWRYIIAMNDMIACHYEVSPQLYEWLTGELAENIGEIVEENVFSHTPKYDRVSAVPTEPNDGDWILWDAASTARFTKGHLYIYQKETVSWIELNPLDESGEVRSKFMTALADILEVNPTETGYFSTVFAQAFFSNTATINKLSTYEFILEDDGLMKSKGFVSGSSGWMIKGDGTAQFNNITVSGYATDSDLNGVKTTAENAASAAATADGKAVSAASAAATADQKAVSAGNAAAEAQQTADKIVSGETELSAYAKQTSLNNVIDGTTALQALNGEILQDAAAPDSAWALKTAGFDPSDENCKGIGIKKNGNIYAYNGIFRGTVYATNGLFKGFLNCGSLKVLDKALYYLDFTYSGSEASPSKVISYFYKYRNSGVVEVNLENEISKLHIAAKATIISNNESINIECDAAKFRFEEKKVDKTTYYYLYIDEIYKIYVSGYDVNDMQAYKGEVLKLALMFENLPTSKPTEANMVWNDKGTLKLS